MVGRTGRARTLLPVLVTALVAALWPVAAASAAPATAPTGTDPGAATAATAPLPTAVVAMGDSYISGEAGRWLGNSTTITGNRAGTDRAAFRVGGLWFYNATRVYGASDANGCHRSDVAEVRSSAIAVGSLINLACSGARTVNILRGTSGGIGQGGEAPQADQLAAVAATRDVELIVLSVGGNDLGFGSIILACTTDYLGSTTWWPKTCNQAQQINVDARMGAAMSGVRAAIDEIRAVMAAAGQAGGYRLVLQSYPSPLPRGSEFRYGEGGLTRTTTGGCPVWNVDATWARDRLVPQIATNLAAVAAAAGVEFLDVSDLLAGHEVCSRSAKQGTGTTAEWARFLVTGLTQGVAAESLHPNAYGQQALGACLRAMFAAAPGNRRCTNVTGQAATVVRLAAR